MERRFSNRLEQPRAVHILIENQPGRSGPLKSFRVAQLMLIGGEGKRNQDRRPPRRRQFRNSTCAGA